MDGGVDGKGHASWLGMRIGGTYVPQDIRAVAVVPHVDDSTVSSESPGPLSLGLVTS
jgi:hypothetical protein